MAVRVRNRKGNEVILLNPAEKGDKFADELRNGVHLTNDKRVKFRKNGKPRKLNDTEKAYRSGYLAARKDSAKCYNAKNGKSNNAVVIYRP